MKYNKYDITGNKKIMHCNKMFTFIIFDKFSSTKSVYNSVSQRNYLQSPLITRQAINIFSINIIKAFRN